MILYGGVYIRVHYIYWCLYKGALYKCALQSNTIAHYILLIVRIAQVGTQPGGADVVAVGAAVWPSTHVVAYSLFVLPLFASLGQGPNVLLNPVRMTVTEVTC